MKEDFEIEHFVTADLWQLAVTLTKAQKQLCTLLSKDEFKAFVKLDEANTNLNEALMNVTEAIGTNIYDALAKVADNE